MWQLTNQTPYAVDRAWTRDKNGAYIWVVAVKATYDIRVNGELALAHEPTPPLLAPEFWGDEATSSLRWDADLVPPKTSTDVILEGSAYAPRGAATSRVFVSLRMGDVSKSLVVHGPRVYDVTVRGQVVAGGAEAFREHPIRYEDAFGGADLTDPDPRRQVYDTQNPVGKGRAFDPRRLRGTPAHRVEYADGTERPAGFGPIASFWSPRRERAGTYGVAWDRDRKPLLPDDYDELHLQSAPDDQRPSQPLRGGEPVVIENMTPDGFLRFNLPRIYPTFTTWFGSRSQEHRARMGTVLVQPGERKVVLVFQTSLRVPHRELDYLDRTVVGEKTYIS
ncbi:MAG TPA: DUF2169 domain-containing protein [Polyangiaceae bacterium]|jgi:hypothetical protein|nr:DUF2169 domain-containing protein [Polyangiaceae bacterium]